MRLLAGAAAALALAAPAAAAVHVDGNRLVDGSGKTVRLLGVNRSSAEYACVQGWGIFEGPTDAAAVAAMASWRINAVRLPLNEHCWLGVNGVPRAYSGPAYRRAVVAFVRRLHAQRLFVIIDLHWNAPGRQRATGQQRLADVDHSPAFWRSVARTFRSDGDVLFDLYNEPHDIGWKCWRDGCGRLAGMQRLVDAVRSTGARQPLLLGGLQWSNDLSGWLRWKPRDPLGQLVASFHLYNFNACADVACWDRTIRPVAARVPVVTGELGEDDCTHGFVDGYMPWADAAGISYLGWTWNAWDCKTGPALVTGYDGSPTPFGEGLRAHLASLRTG